MKVVNAYPPNIEEIRRSFNIEGKSVVFTYGDTLYAPNSSEISPDLMVHEETHAEQQSHIGTYVWWDRYITNPAFRLDQELEAYRNQYQWAVENLTRHYRRALLKRIAEDLSSDLYGNVIDTEEAIKLIKNNENTSN